HLSSSLFSFFTHPSASVFCTLSLHDALPIFSSAGSVLAGLAPLGASLAASAVDVEEGEPVAFAASCGSVAMVESLLKNQLAPDLDRKSTRLNSSHLVISYAVFCLKKKKKKRE